MARNGISQWGWRELEELLQCPVCLDIPAIGTVEQCRHGHHICVNCRKNVENCPLCKCDFHGTRNFVLEELVRHFDILKNTMLLNNIVTEDKQKTRKAKVHTVRDDRPTLLLKSEPVRRAVHTPPAATGSFPCRAVDCEEILPLGRLLNHVRSHHHDILTESVVDFTDIYSQTFEIPFKNKKPITKNCFIIFASGIGLVYLNLEIMRSGQLIVYLQMASKFRKCQELLGSVELFSETTTYCFNIRLVSTRIGFCMMLTENSCFSLSKPQFKKICENKKFNCKLTLTRFDRLNPNVLTAPNREQILITAGIRASLLSEQCDKKLIKQIEGHKNKKPSYNVTPSTSNHHPQSPVIEEIVAKVLESLNMKDMSSVSGIVNNILVPPSDIEKSQSVTERQKSKKKKTRRPNGN